MSKRKILVNKLVHANCTWILSTASLSLGGGNMGDASIKLLNDDVTGFHQLAVVFFFYRSTQTAARLQINWPLYKMVFALDCFVEPLTSSWYVFNLDCRCT